MITQHPLKFFLFLSPLVFFSYINASFSSQARAVIFDCDGVLVDSEHLKHRAWQVALKEIGVDFSIEDYKPLLGNSGAYIAQAIQKSKDISVPWQGFMNRRNEVYKQIHAQGAPAIESAVVCVQTLMTMKSADFKLGLASSPGRDEIFRNLKGIGLEDAFDDVISGKDDLSHIQDSEGTNKPKPYIYREIAKRLQVDPANCLVFEDSQAGVEAASKAGMIVIAIPNDMTRGQDFSLATEVFNSFEKISGQTCLELLRKYQKNPH